MIQANREIQLKKEKRVYFKIIMKQTNKQQKLYIH